MSPTGGLVLDQARLWLGTPYRHQASICGVGCDCLGLLRGIWRGVYGDEAEHPPPYCADWLLPGSDDVLLEGLCRHLTQKPVGEADFGDVLVFRMALGVPCRHVAIVSGSDSIIHTYWGRQVTQTHLVGWWRRRIVSAFSFPAVEVEVGRGGQRRD